jgi:ribosome-associated protein
MGYILSSRRLENSQFKGSISTQSTTSAPETPEVLRDLRLAATTLDDFKAQDVVILDLRGLSDATDYFILASGSSDTHVRALSERVMEALRTVDRRTHHSEGLRAGRWALLDYFDFVVHVFHPKLREFYQLERLWVDAPSIQLNLDR